jgi:hypothetical protein
MADTQTGVLVAGYQNIEEATEDFDRLGGVMICSGIRWLKRGVTCPTGPAEGPAGVDCSMGVVPFEGGSRWRPKGGGRRFPVSPVTDVTRSRGRSEAGITCRIPPGL